MRNNTKTTHYLNDPLWKKLTEFPLEDGFSKRLARENEWGVLFTEQVIGEYRKFLYLTQVAGHPVTPSKAVDKAWHLHLLYTRSYWDGLCNGILGEPLHHEPGTGKSGDATQFAAQYARTQASYRAIFGTEPPAAVWGRHSEIPKATQDRSHQKRALGWLATGLGGVALIGASGGDAFFGIVFVGILVVLVAVAFRAQRPEQNRRGTPRGTNATTSEDTTVASSCGGFFGVSSSETVLPAASSESEQGASHSHSHGQSVTPIAIVIAAIATTLGQAVAPAATVGPAPAQPQARVAVEAPAPQVALVEAASDTIGPCSLRFSLLPILMPLRATRRSAFSPWLRPQSPSAGGLW